MFFEINYFVEPCSRTETNKNKHLSLRLTKTYWIQVRGNTITNHTIIYNGNGGPILYCALRYTLLQKDITKGLNTRSLILSFIHTILHKTHWPSCSNTKINMIYCVNFSLEKTINVYFELNSHSEQPDS